MTRATARAPLRRRRRAAGGGMGSRRGVALILVLTTLAILTAVGVDFSYSSRVLLRLAENARDELRAYMLARSAVNLSRMLLHFQKQIDGLGAQISGALAGIGRQLGGSSAAVAAKPPPPAGGVFPPGAGAPASLGIRLWEIVPVDSNAFGVLFAGGIPSEASAPEKRDDDFFHRDKGPLRAADAPPMHSFGTFDGSYSAKITDENTRINVARLGALSSQTLAPFLQFRALMADPKYDFLFNEQDANRDRVQRDDVLINLRDWIDEDERGSTIDPLNSRAPFVDGFSDENAPYSRYNPRYKAKNARPDSLEELYMVNGISDRFMAAFGERLTVWLDKNSGININTSDPLQMITNIIFASANPNDPRLRDPRLLQTILQEIQLRKMVSFFGLSVADFVATLQANGITVRTELTNAAVAGQYFVDKSDTFRITATGRVGRIEKKIVAVVQYDDLMGKLLYWKEE